MAECGVSFFLRELPGGRVRVLGCGIWLPEASGHYCCYAELTDGCARDTARGAKLEKQKKAEGGTKTRGFRFLPNVCTMRGVPGEVNLLIERGPVGSSQSPASCDLEVRADQTMASRVRSVNLEDCTRPLAQTSAGAVWSGRGLLEYW